MTRPKIETAAAPWLCGHVDRWPVNVLAKRLPQITSRNCPECRARDEYAALSDDLLLRCEVSNMAAYDVREVEIQKRGLR